jgi:RimJ/RimL family protein N-acetyltransferase
MSRAAVPVGRASSNEPSLRLARRVGYRFEGRIPRHCRDFACADAERDTWHDCLIWVHTAGGPPGTAR